MCLLIVLARTHPAFPLVVAANRDERLDRPATPMTVLRTAGPRTLGGRDLVGGGTWFAVNEHGVFAGLTNRPPAPGDAPKRTRGELPVALTGHRTAAEAVEAFTLLRPSDYNPAWLLAGDRDHVFAMDVTGGDAVLVTPVAPGVHILENHPPGTSSPKVAHVRSRLEGIEPLAPGPLVERLQAVLADHRVPAPAGDPDAGYSAACVHLDGYGTRWAGVVTVPPGRGDLPTFRYADGPPCRAPFVDAGHLWNLGPLAGGRW